jgi:hypothetical protein
VTNTARAPLEVEVRAGSADRYSVSPASLRLGPGESADLSVTLRVLRFGQRAKAVEAGQRDWVAVKVVNFPSQDQRFHATFFLDPAEAPGDRCGAGALGGGCHACRLRGAQAPSPLHDRHRTPLVAMEGLCGGWRDCKLAFTALHDRDHHREPLMPCPPLAPRHQAPQPRAQPSAHATAQPARGHAPARQPRRSAEREPAGGCAVVAAAAA